MKYTVNALLKIRCSGTESAISRVSENDTIAYFGSVGLIYACAAKCELVANSASKALLRTATILTHLLERPDISSHLRVASCNPA